MTKVQDERVKARKALTKRVLVRIEGHNAAARKRKIERESALETWGKNRSTDKMIPYVQSGDQDSRPIVDPGPPVRRAYLHEYGWTRAERRSMLASLNRNRRRQQRREMGFLFRQLWDSQRARNEEA